MGMSHVVVCTASCKTLASRQSSWQGKDRDEMQAKGAIHFPRLPFAA